MSNIELMIDGIPTVQVNNPHDLGEFELIDVRRPDEFNGDLGHIQGAKLNTLGPELEAYLQSADQQKKILFICRSGMRSINATQFALSLGFKNVFNMEGGMMLWNQKGFPVQRD